MNAPPTFTTIAIRRQRGVPGASPVSATALAALYMLLTAVALLGCRDPEVTSDSPEARAERSEEAAERVALESGSSASDHAPCPEPRELPADQVCAEVVTYAQSPDGGRCCFYGSPCEVPEGWTQHADPACKAPLRDTATDMSPPAPEETTREL